MCCDETGVHAGASAAAVVGMRQRPLLYNYITVYIAGSVSMRQVQAPPFLCGKKKAGPPLVWAERASQSEERSSHFFTPQSF